MLYTTMNASCQQAHVQATVCVNIGRLHFAVLSRPHDIVSFGLEMPVK